VPTSPSPLTLNDSNRTETRNVSVSLPIGQMYHVGLDDRNPYWVYSDRQDDGSMRISSAAGIQNANILPAMRVGTAPDATATGRAGANGRGAGAAGGRGAAGGGRGAGGGGGGGGGGGAGARGAGGGGGRGGNADAYDEEAMP